MLSTARHHTSREYVERGVQTDIARKTPSSRPSSPHIMEPPPHLQDEVAQLAKLTISSPQDRSREPTGASSAYSHDYPDLSFESASSADRSMTTTTRTFEMEHLSVARPTTLADRKPTARVVSLPEATPRFRMKKVIEKSARVVSMPLAAPKDVDRSSDSFDVSGDIFVSEDDERTRVRVRSQATDVPHTPSAPSSPDSIVIIANNSNQLSNDFLRQRTTEESPLDSDDEGMGQVVFLAHGSHDLDLSEWISWSKSPPRPIPALHGPLSLPYARCPSYESQTAHIAWLLTCSIVALKGRLSKNQKVSLASSGGWKAMKRLGHVLRLSLRLPTRTLRSPRPRSLASLLVRFHKQNQTPSRLRFQTSMPAHEATRLRPGSPRSPLIRQARRVSAVRPFTNRLSLRTLF